MSEEIIQGYSRASIERILGLPQGYLKDKRHLKSEETKALLKIIKTFPWILAVADSGYNENVVRRELCHSAIESGLVDK